MLDLQVTRELDGVPVNFSKLAPGGFLVVDVNGKSSLVSREQWAMLPKWELSARETRRLLFTASHEAWVIAVLGVILGLSCAIAFVFASVNASVQKLLRMMRRRAVGRCGANQ